MEGFREGDEGCAGVFEHPYQLGKPLRHGLAGVVPYYQGEVVLGVLAEGVELPWVEIGYEVSVVLPCTAAEGFVEPHGQGVHG